MVSMTIGKDINAVMLLVSMTIVNEESLLRREDGPAVPPISFFFRHSRLVGNEALKSHGIAGCHSVN